MPLDLTLLLFLMVVHSMLPTLLTDMMDILLMLPDGAGNASGSYSVALPDGR